MPNQLITRCQNRERPNILIITSERPCGPTYGAQIRLINIARLLSRLGDVSFVVAGQPEMVSHECEFDIKRIAHLVQLPKRGIVGRIHHELNPSFLETEGHVVCETDRAVVLGLMGESDIIWIHGLKTANMLRVLKWPRSVLDIDDIPSLVFSSQAKEDSGIVMRMNNYRKSIIWRRRERLLRQRFSFVTVCSEEDRRYLGDSCRATVIPNGFESPEELPRHIPTAPPRIGFIGGLKWPPNKQGIERFMSLVWPRIKLEVPTARLRLVGEGSDAGFSQLGADIDGLGWVSDPRQEIATWSAMVIPIYMGAGTRVKVADAFSKKCPVVSTPLGAFGYSVVHGEDLLIADNDIDLASACILLAKDQALGMRLAENAWNKFIRNWTWDSIGDVVTKVARDCMVKGSCELLN